MPTECLSGVILPTTPILHLWAPLETRTRVELAVAGTCRALSFLPDSVHGAPFPGMLLPSRTYSKKKNLLHLSSSMRPLPASVDRDDCCCYRLVPSRGRPGWSRQPTMSSVPDLHSAGAFRVLSSLCRLDLLLPIKRVSQEEPPSVCPRAHGASSLLWSQGPVPRSSLPSGNIQPWS